MTSPIGSDQLVPLYVYDDDERKTLIEEAAQMPSVELSSAAAANAVMLGGGYFTPLKGYMNLADALGCADNMHMTDGSFFPVPILNLVDSVVEIEGAELIALRDPNVVGNPVIAVQKVEAIDHVDDEQMRFMTEKVYRTTDSVHPGVAAFNGHGRYAVSGPIQVLNFSYFETEFPDTFRTAVQIREEIEKRGWKRVVAFQTRNPMHRSHEHLAKIAVEVTDGVFIHQVLGKLKPGDIPASVRTEAIQAMIDNYFVPGTVIQAGYPIEMRYGGPREALLHALIRQNYGCSHLIVGRDHAGVGDYYGPFEAQEIFDTLWDGALVTKALKIGITFYCTKCYGMATARTCPHDKEYQVSISGTRQREMLANGEAIPPEFSRPEVVAILQRFYAGQKSV